MVTQAQETAPVTAAPAEPVPVAVYCRTSTLALQDPVASVRRQLRSCQQWLPQGWFIAAVFADVESGGTDLEARGHGDAWRILTDAGLPRDGGIADLLTEAASPAPRFAAVVCEDIERSARDMLSSLRLEKQLSQQGIPLFATDEPADIAGMNATTVLVRRVKQGVAEWYRIQLKEKIWKGLVEHSMDGWNIGPAPHGYRADRVPHPNSVKAAQGRTKSRLVLDPATAPTVKAIFQWRTVDKLGLPAIASRLNASPAIYPPPAGSDGWAASSVDAILRNPKYTGHQVFGRHRTRGGRRVNADPADWLWTPGPVHPAIIDRATWQAAQHIGAEHATSRDSDSRPAPPPNATYYLYRSRVLCKTCKKRMTGTANGPGRAYVYYRCPHQPDNPRHRAAAPDHPRTVQAAEHRLEDMAAKFFLDRIFGPGRAAYLAAQLPATDAEAAARRDTEAAKLRATIKKLDGQQNAQIRALETIPDGPAAAAMRARISDRFTELHTQRTDAEAKLTALQAAVPTAMDPALLDEIPYAGDILPHLPPALKTRLLAAFDITITWNKPGNQATVRGVITDATLQAVLDILNPGQDGYHDTAATSADSPLTRTPLLVSVAQSTGSPQPGGCLMATTRADLIVVGAGLAGSAAAWAAADRGMDVVVLEALQPGHRNGSSHGSARIFRRAYPDRLYVRLTGRAGHLWRQLEADAGEPLLQQTGGLDFGARRNPKQLHDVLTELGVAAELLQPEAAAERWPYVDFSGAGQVMYHAEAGVLDPDHAMAAMLRLAAADGADVRFGTPVTRLEAAPGGDGAVAHTDSGTFAAPVVAVAAGAWLPGLIGDLVPLPPLTVTQQQVFHFAPRQSATQSWPIAICQHEADNFYALPGGRDGELPGAIKLGSDDRDKLTTATTRDFEVDPAARDAATGFVIRRLPGLVSTPVNEVTCLYTSTGNKDFILDRRGPFVIASACSGHGAKFAPLLGEIIVALSAGDPPSDERFTLAEHLAAGR